MKIVDPLADPRWDEKLRSWREATVFHTSAWARVLRDSYGFTPFALCDSDDDRFRALLPIMEVRSVLTGCRAVSLPFSDHCEPFFPDDRSGRDVIEALSPIAKERKWESCEIRGGDRFFGNFPAASIYSCHSLDLGLPEQAIFDRFKENVGRNIRKARREGVSVSRDSSLAALKQFYRLHCLTRRGHGLPPQPFSFFQNVHEHIFSRGMGDLFLATFKGQPVAGAVFFHFGSKALFKYGASDRRIFHSRPNDLVMWEAIRWYAGRGQEQLCFGRSEMAQLGLRRFKAKWGSVERTIRYYRYEFNKGTFAPARPSSIGKVSALVVSHLPLFVGHLPLSVIRMIGRLLYRHVA